jgi:hypothetical protein
MQLVMRACICIFFPAERLVGRVLRSELYLPARLCLGHRHCGVMCGMIGLGLGPGWVLRSELYPAALSFFRVIV